MADGARPAGRGHRYAVYFAPGPETALWRLGSAVLGYDAASGADVAAKVPEGWSAEAWHALTDDPRTYGFHATLKAPFRPREGVTEGDLLAALQGLGRASAAFSMDLQVARLGSFVAIVPRQAPAALGALAFACVERFEDMRSPLNAGEIARRRPERLTERQRAYLDRFGYPYVAEDFRFHMTLTGALPAGASDPVDALRRLFAPVIDASPTLLDGISLCRQDTPDSRFKIVARVALQG